jgi:glycosyltransferase involved in cell wall biosynthesis
VLLPVRDARPWISAALASLEHQSLDRLQAVLVDDGSCDGTAEALDRWAVTWSRRPGRQAEVLHLEPTGLVGALEAGRSRCTAPLIARMDGDDIAHPRRLELQAALLAARPEVDVVSCRVRLFPRDRLGTGFVLYEQWLDGLAGHDDVWRERFVESPVVHPSVMLRRSALERAGGWRDMGWPEDYDLWLRLLELGSRFARVPRHLLLWREHPRRLTRRDRRYATRRFLACKAHHLLRGPLAARPPVIVWGAGRTGRWISSELLAGDAWIEAFVDIDPAKIGRQVRGRPVISADRLAGLLEGLRDGPSDRAASGPPLVLAAVASRGARAEIRARLEDLGLVETRHFWCVA